MYDLQTFTFFSPNYFEVYNTFLQTSVTPVRLSFLPPSLPHLRDPYFTLCWVILLSDADLSTTQRRVTYLPGYRNIAAKPRPRLSN